MSREIIEAPPQPRQDDGDELEDYRHREHTFRWLSRLVEVALGGAKETIEVVPGTVNAQDTKEVDVAFPGAEVGDGVSVTKPTATTGIVIGNARVKSDGIVSILFGNVTGGNIAVPTENYELTLIRR